MDSGRCSGSEGSFHIHTGVNGFWSLLIAVSWFHFSQALLQCRSCSSTHSLDHCTVDTCQSNQLCYVGDVGHLLSRTHTARCMSATLCQHLTEAVMKYSNPFGRRKRSFHLCDICCGSDLCNSKSCSEVKHDMLHMYRNQQLDMHTLTQKTSHSGDSDSQ